MAEKAPMDVVDRVLAALRTRPDGEPVAVKTLVRELGLTTSEVLDAAAVLERREHGSRDLVSLVKRTGVDGEELFLSRIPEPLNEEPPG
ncbi:MAG: hypothetical protein JWR11_4481 [Mycobacterium sp.]|nr:hypothetical protein [Mycobacterium sp.]MDT5070061.1 hypothetical protein [Mycobacterium sp.]MDT5179226.1 hypothetical protein [Mycobacterium sp.]